MMKQILKYLVYGLFIIFLGIPLCIAMGILYILMVIVIIPFYYIISPIICGINLKNN